MEICQFKVYIQKDSLILAFIDKMAEWLIRWTVNPLGFASAGSNPSCRFFIWFWGEKWIAIFSLNSAIRVQISEKTGIIKTSATTFFEIKKKKTDDNVENNDQVIMPGLETRTF